jgi:thiamine-monophosphate kinase
MPAPPKSIRIPANPLTERALIAAIRTQVKKGMPVRQGILAVGIGDDCAVLRPRPKEDLVVTTDFSLEDVHFRRDWHPPQSVGHRCLARGLSDLAAMGARPEAAFLSMALPPALTMGKAGGKAGGSWVEGFLEGFMRLAERFEVPLGGGDTARSPGAKDGLASMDIVLIGSVPRDRAMLRSGARAGDILCVTGALGGSAAELEALERRPAAFRTAANAGHPHLYPEPRLEAGRKLMRRGLATAAIDLSDGLSTDLSHLCDESGLAAEIQAESVPVDARATLQQALHGGEDYELLFTISRKHKVPKHIGGVEVHPIGRMKKAGKGPQVEISENGERTSLVAAGWDHFR